MDSRPESLLAQNARQILALALDSDFGIRVKLEMFGDLPNIALRAKQVLYRFKKENNDYDILGIAFDPDEPDYIWVVKDNPDLNLSGQFDTKDLQLFEDP